MQFNKLVRIGRSIHSYLLRIEAALGTPAAFHPVVELHSLLQVR